MKTKIAFIITLLAMLGLSNAFAQFPGWLWAKSSGGSGNDVTKSVAPDANGNVYATGYFPSASILFGSTTLTNTSTGTDDVFLTKYDASGNVLWAKSAGGSSGDDGRSVAVDNSGNVYVAGVFNSSSITFGSTTLNNLSPGKGDVFIAKYNPSGNFIWAQTSSNSFDSNSLLAVTTDDSNNVYTAGIFQDVTITFGSTILTNFNSNYIDLFLVKYDSSGNVKWAKSAGGSDHDVPYSIAVDASGNTFIAGYFRSPTIVFGSTTLTNANSGIPDMFIAKYDANGNVLWAKSAGGTGDDEAYSVALDATGCAYVGGYFYSPTIVFGSTTLTNTDNTGTTSDIFLVKYNPSGSVAWAKSASGTNIDQIHSVCAGRGEQNKFEYATGFFQSDSITFGSITLTNPNYPNQDIFVVKYDAGGNAIWATSVGGSQNNFGNSISSDASGNVFVGGGFASPSCVFSSTTLTNAYAGTDDIFVAKIGTGTGIDEFSNSINISIYPNPATDNLTIDVSATLNIPATIEIINIQSQVIKQQTTNVETTNIDVSALAKGMYFVKVKTEKGVAVKKIIIE